MANKCHWMICKCLGYKTCFVHSARLPPAVRVAQKLSCVVNACGLKFSCSLRARCTRWWSPRASKLLASSASRTHDTCPTPVPRLVVPACVAYLVVAAGVWGRKAGLWAKGTVTWSHKNIGHYRTVYINYFWRVDLRYFVKTCVMRNECNPWLYRELSIGIKKL